MYQKFGSADIEYVSALEHDENPIDQKGSISNNALEYDTANSKRESIDIKAKQLC
jgi:hypothetical protein